MTDLLACDKYQVWDAVKEGVGEVNKFEGIILCLAAPRTVTLLLLMSNVLMCNFLYMTICHVDKFLHMTDMLACGGCDKYQVWYAFVRGDG